MNNTVIELLENARDKNGSSAIYSFLDRRNKVYETISARQLYQRCLYVASYLQEISSSNETVVLYYSHGPDFLYGFYGSILAGLVPIPITQPRGRNWEVVHKIFRDSNSKMLLTTSKKKKFISEDFLPDDSGVVVINTDEIIELKNETWSRPKAKMTDLAFIQYTSGSTTIPKGVCITHSNLLANSKEIQESFNNTKEDIIITWLPFHHDMGLIGHIIQPLFVGAHNYFIPPTSFLSSPINWLSTISKFNGTVSGAPNFGYNLCLSKVRDDQIDNIDLSSWRLAYCGSERIIPRTLTNFSEKFYRCGFNPNAFYPCYGLAESTLFVCGRHGLKADNSAGHGAEHVSVGRLGSGSLMIDSTKEFKVCESLDVGEILIKSDSISPGYFQNKTETANVFKHSVNNKEEFLKTGDIGYLKDGELYIIGRKKNLIKCRGKNYYSEDIEHAIEENMGSSTFRSAAFAEYTELGDELVLFVETTAENIKSIDFKTRIGACVTENVGIVPFWIELVEKNTIPLTTSGKIQRSKCRESFQRKQEALS